ncbi:hypothetical protein DLREEDagrD3_24630 [Denitratisoma sp. agr-D3]
MNKSTRTLLLIVGLLVSPVVVASVLYLSGWQPGGQPNGELLQPAQSLTLPAELINDRWMLVVAGNGPCTAQCEKLLEESRRVHVALYKQMPRVARLWLSDDAKAIAADGARLKQAQPDLLSAALPTWGERSDSATDRRYRLYLMDPKGRLVMRYPVDAAPKGILKDLERLLRYS